jgi:hypothetical protein
MKFKNIYIHERKLFVCFVPMVHEIKVIITQGKLLNLKIRILRKNKLTNSCRSAQVVNMKGM